MLLFLAVWLLVSNSTRRLLKQVRQLEDFLRVCAWCRRIDYKGEWMPLEDFMEQGFDTPTTHGICPECLRQKKEAMERARARTEKRHRRPAEPDVQPVFNGFSPPEFWRDRSRPVGAGRRWRKVPGWA